MTLLSDLEKRFDPKMSVPTSDAEYLAMHAHWQQEMRVLRAERDCFRENFTILDIQLQTCIDLASGDRKTPPKRGEDEGWSPLVPLLMDLLKAKAGG